MCDVGRMDMRHAEKDVEIAVGVMSALAVLLAAVEAWSWARRYVHPLVQISIKTPNPKCRLFLKVPSGQIGST
jgi:hypothetical protein